MGSGEALVTPFMTSSGSACSAGWHLRLWIAIARIERRVGEAPTTRKSRGRRVVSGRVLCAVRVVLAAQISVAAVEEPQHGRYVRWPADLMADTLRHRIGRLGIAMLDELVALRI